MSLAEARDEARRWRKLLKQGTDPAVERERQRDAEVRRRADTFEALAEAYFAFIKRQGLRRVHEVERDMRRDFVTRWAKRPITDIDWFDVKAVIDAAIKRGSPWQAHHVFSNAQRIFAGREQGTYGLTMSPCDGRRPSKIIGPKQPRTRVLDDDEVRALWRASGRTSYPFGPPGAHAAADRSAQERSRRGALARVRPRQEALEHSDRAHERQGGARRAFDRRRDSDPAQPPALCPRGLSVFD